jgi:hypothetical protein
MQKLDWRERGSEIYWFYKFSISQIWFHEFEQINKQPMEKRPPFLQIACQQSWHEGSMTHQLKPSKAATEQC